MELELALHPDDAALLPRLALQAPLKTVKARSRPVRIVWHDSADRALSEQGLALGGQRSLWRLESLHPDGTSWPPGCPAPLIATGRTPAELGQDLPEPLAPVAAFDGRSLSLSAGTADEPIILTLLRGAVRTIAGEQRLARVRLDGSSQAVQSLALRLSQELRLTVPRASLAAEAMAIADTGRPTPARAEGAPELPKGLSVAEAFAHVVGHLTDVFLHFAPAVADGTDGTEPVHQMRVAVRRLRSAIKVFRRAVRCPAVDAADAGLKALAARLGPTRDWDVFVTETAAAVVAAFPAEKRLQRLLGAAERRRRACHTELCTFLNGPEFRQLGIELACLTGSADWHTTLDAAERAELATPLDAFAGSVLNRRLKRATQDDATIAELEPAELHGIRLRVKRLRYAAEIFAPLHPGKPTSRFIRRLTRLQDQLGTLNDGAVAASLLAELGGSRGQAFAAGLVLGFVGAHGTRMRRRIDQAWQKFRDARPFWD